ncbi:uncharacterized protein LOC116196021 isoform X2 [Punica granatum]|uniref:Uncharacterized protein LOC116196021 isoform X2 n=1 Tax=Punica granatum TaxID=22663 RepID=A0A6P8CG24_PUNGR|nr:uncharacterized protein LOC116196021 isoform X2 [Punica granatum]
MAASVRFCFSKAMELRWATTKTAKNIPNKPARVGLSIPVYLSTNPSHVNPGSLRDLFVSCNRSCHAFPRIGPDGRVEEGDIAGVDKLRVALDHSSVVVSVFCEPRDLPVDGDGIEEQRASSVGDLMRRVVPPAVTPYSGQLVGFGRAVSDNGLTASIYDVMRMGIGRMIVQRIVRILTGKDIYDIAALCSDDDRLFFEACGFGDDILGSTTMMYTRAITGSSTDGSGGFRRVGRKLLLVPTFKEFHSQSRIRNS